MTYRERRTADANVGLRVGVQTWPEHGTYTAMCDAWQEAESLGVDSIWTWDHFFPLNGDPNGTALECWSLLAGLATQTTRVEFGPLVSCTAYRNPHLLAHMAWTVNEMSGGRLVLGLGAGWYERDFREYDYPLAPPKDRAQQFEADLSVIAERLATLSRSSDDVPPILIGGTGRTTLRLAAQRAQRWNAIADEPAALMVAGRRLDALCDDMQRDPREIERSIALYEPEHLDHLDEFVAAGFTHFIYGVGGPAYDLAPVKTLLTWARDRGLDAGRA